MLPLCWSPPISLLLSWHSLESMGYCCHSMLNAGLLLSRTLLSLWLLSYLSASSRPGCRLGCLPRQGLLQWAGWLCKKDRSSLEHSKAPRSCTSVIKTAGSVDSARSGITVCGFRALESTILWTQSAQGICARIADCELRMETDAERQLRIMLVMHNGTLRIMLCGLS